MHQEQLFHSLEEQYKECAARLLPLRGASESIWRSSNFALKERQGWKLHVTATILNVSETLGILDSYLTPKQIPFKGIAGLRELKKLNAGLYGYSQIGKVFTVYLQSGDSHAEIACNLNRQLAGLSGPRVPYESSIGGYGIVYFRFGSFDDQSVVDPENGRTVKDDRERQILPTGTSCPFHDSEEFVDRERTNLSELRNLSVLEVLSQRGKGGVYKVELRSGARAILKEGRRNGETSPLGRDGWTYVHREKRALTSLSAAGSAVPKVLSSFHSRDLYYLLIEEKSGCQLDKVWWQKTFSSHRQKIAKSMVRELRKAHNLGWFWRDLKPANIICADGNISLIDFEGAARREDRKIEPWGSPHFIPNDWTRPNKCLRSQDYYALAVALVKMYAPSARTIKTESVTHDHYTNFGPKRLSGKSGKLFSCLREIIGRDGHVSEEYANSLEALLY